MDPRDDTLYTCADPMVANCWVYTGNGAELCPLAGGTEKLACCSSLSQYIPVACVGTSAALVSSVSPLSCHTV